jgi:hypothetical protein
MPMSSTKFIVLAVLALVVVLMAVQFGPALLGGK